ncbi:FAD synthase [Drosophila ficusphila]|uniref:FAD synthase n=1 Tax=Drosophila ficusphila TaxID=30025 RepID=UPI001C89D3A3|nr:FAD synthase [Drosophila ficusphila]
MKFALQFCQRVRHRQLQNRGLHMPPVEKTRSNDQWKYKLEHSEDLIKRAMTLYKPNELMLCFNGGKDCTVLLDILAKIKPPSIPLRAVYVKSADPFEELEKFVDDCHNRYGLQLLRYEGVLKLAFEQLLAENPQVKAMFLGCRRSDPGGLNLSEMLPCDNGWPAMMRIFPLLEWSYHDIWSYIRINNLPYCCLYDQGYTSLGDRSSTHLNPSLLAYDENLGKMTYRAAFELEDTRMERVNRDEHDQGTMGESKQQ